MNEQSFSNASAAAAAAAVSLDISSRGGSSSCSSSGQTDGSISLSLLVDEKHLCETLSRLPACERTVERTNEWRSKRLKVIAFFSGRCRRVASPRLHLKEEPPPGCCCCGGKQKALGHRVTTLPRWCWWPQQFRASCSILLYKSFAPTNREENGGTHSHTMCAFMLS